MSNPADNRIEALTNLLNAERERREKFEAKITQMVPMLAQEQGHTKAMMDAVKATESQIKILAARCEALHTDVEALKKISAGMADIAALKKLIADLTKRVDAIKK